MALFVGPLCFCKLETSALNLTMKSQGSEFILSWAPRNNTGTPTYYRVTYIALGPSCLTHRTPNAIQSKSPERNQLQSAASNKPKQSHFKTAEECSNITNLFCNLTKEFTDFCKMYYIKVQQFTENGTKESALHFNPYTETCLPPAWFDIATCPNCINVTVKLSSSLLEIYHRFRYKVKVVKAGFTETPIDDYTRKESFHTVVGGLSPNTNYCISVDVSSSMTDQCTLSALKCIVTNSKDKSGLVAFSVIGGIVMVLALIFSVIFLLKAGFVRLKEKWPEVLNIIPKFDNSLVPLDPKAHNIQIIQKGKRKGTEYHSDDDYESGGENDGGYTHHGLLHKISKSCSKADSKEQLSIDSSSAASDCPLLDAANCELLDAEVENPQCHSNEAESATSQTFSSTSELNFTSLPESEISGCLNINLNTVMVGIPDRNWDAGTTLSPYEEDAADLPELCVSDASEPRDFTERKDMQHSGVHNLSYAQQNSAGSGESESSDSETDCIGEYMRR
ncbi:interferon alpha/beta receptor 2 isoform X2 [Tiliqua scincoides]|uniref:interferon alpha/beta receptor 2 isoform X2 n=1 Tax=Tiliqua scincoides TaxID=71010 RepID=UPI00346383AC